ncbi:porin, partial [Salmonella sp. SAL4434]|uniref:porin n=1 Tax=Salmonella sp. SAL4434 TaxID=3159889 RepID=UPI00397BD545
RYVTPFDRAQDATGFLSRGRLNVDARTETAYGTVRAFLRYELTGLTGSYANVPFFGGQTNTSFIDKAFIQFAGITAGRIQSFFDFYA